MNHEEIMELVKAYKKAYQAAQREFNERHGLSEFNKTPQQTERLCLRRFREGDEDACFGWLSDEDTCQLSGSLTFFAEKDESYLQRMKDYADTCTMYLIELKMSGEAIGYVDISAPDEEDSTAAMIGYVISPAYRGNGYAAEAVEGLIHRLEAFPSITALLAEIQCQNEPSVAVAEKLGFTRIGQRENSTIYHSQLVNTWLYERKPS